MSHRDEVLRRLETNPRIPVLILGGGVNGIGLFRELALQGVDCLLVDKADFVAGASSKSSRMIHGGLRYLENRELRLVRESLTERNRLLENAGHYVTPLKTTIPLFSWLGGLVRSTLVFFGFPVRPGGRGAVIVKLGLSFYDFVTRRNRRTPRHYLSSKAKSLAAIPALNPDIVATATYWDARITQAERLCIEMLRDACDANSACRALNYVRLTPRDSRHVVPPSGGVRVEPSGVPSCHSEDRLKAELRTPPEGGTTYSSLTFQDEVTGQQFSVEPQIVVNATGAWVDSTNALLGLTTHVIGGTKGSHLVVDNKELFETLAGGMVYYEHKDGRICIVFPFGDKVLMGSTDIRTDDPDTARCDEGEIDYMLATLRGIFPGITIRRDQIVYTFCGVRPLPASEQGYTGRVSRGHSIAVVEPDGAASSSFVIRHSSFVTGSRPFPILCLIGGKWTTFRAFSEQVADQILPRLGLARRCSTEHAPIGGGHDFPQGPEQRAAWIARLAAASALPPQRIATLLDRYGTDAEDYASAADTRAETPLRSLPDYTLGEIERIAANEQVVHLTDLVCRRSTIAILGLATPDALRELAEIVGPILAWDAARKEAEIASALAETGCPASS